MLEAQVRDFTSRYRCDLQDRTDRLNQEYVSASGPRMSRRPESGKIFRAGASNMSRRPESGKVFPMTWGGWKGPQAPRRVWGCLACWWGDPDHGSEAWGGVD